MLVFIKQLQLTGKQLVSLSLSVEKVRKYLLIQRLQKELAQPVLLVLIKQLQLTGKQLVSLSLSVEKVRKYLAIQQLEKNLA